MVSVDALHMQVSRPSTTSSPKLCLHANINFNCDNCSCVHVQVYQQTSLLFFTEFYEVLGRTPEDEARGQKL